MRSAVIRIDPPETIPPAVARDAEAGLVARAAQGDGAAFEALYRAHAARIFALGLRLTGDRALAEEHTQDCFVRAWENLGSFRGEAGFATWLHRIAANVALGGLRSRKRWRLKVVSGADDALLESVAAPIAAPHEGLDLERGIAGLPPGARAVFVLHDVEGWQHEEIAEQLGLAVGTSKAQLHRARRLLRERLG